MRDGSYNRCVGIITKNIKQRLNEIWWIRSLSFLHNITVDGNVKEAISSGM